MYPMYPNSRCGVMGRDSYRPYPMSYAPHYYPMQPYIQQAQKPADPVDTLQTIMMMYGANDVKTLLDRMPRELLYQTIVPYLRELYLKQLGAPLRAVRGQAVGTYEYSVADYIRDHGQPEKDWYGTVLLKDKGLTSLEGLDQITDPEKVRGLDLSSNFLSDKYIGNGFPSYVDTAVPSVPSVPSHLFVNLGRLDLGNNRYYSVPEFVNRMNSLTYLYLSKNRIDTIESGTFNGLNSLRVLELSDNQINTIESGTFNGLDRLESLWLRGNQIDTIESGTFNNLNIPKTLDLSNNRIDTIKPGAFNGLNSLKDFDLSNNQINTIESGTFNNLNILKSLDLSNNQIDTIESGTFNGLNSLENLDLSNNRIVMIKPRAFNGLNSLEDFDLSNNRIDTIESGTFNGLNSLQHLNLSGNQINTIERGTFDGLVHLRSLDIGLNYIPGTVTDFKKNHRTLQEVSVWFDPQNRR